MMQSNQMPTLEAVRARRKEIAAEDAALATIEADLVRVAEKWKAMYQRAVAANFEAASIREEAARVILTHERKPSAPRQRTKNDAIIEALSSPRDLWQTANQVQDYLTVVLGKPVPMSSVSPALSGLKKNGTLVRQDMHVALALRVEKEEPGFLNENGPPEGGPETSGD